MFKLSQFYEYIEKWIKDTNPLYPNKYNKLALIQLNELKKQGDISIFKRNKKTFMGYSSQFDILSFLFFFFFFFLH